MWRSTPSAAPLDIARIAQSAELLGISRQALDIVLDYVKVRVPFGKPIGANQALQHRLVDAYIDVELAAACLREVLARFEDDPSRLPELASRAKARCAKSALNVTRLAIQLHGAIDITDECDIGFYWKRAVNLATWLGDVHLHHSRYMALKGMKQIDPRKGPDALNAAIPGVDTDWSRMTEYDFRIGVRMFLQEHCPAHLRNPPTRLHWKEVSDWYFILSKQGWIAPAWPKEHGGMGLPPDKLIAFIEELEDFGAPRLPDQGIINLGPLLIKHGTEWQKAYWLPKIISGEHIWCQGYSEPNAGSDLASLRTEAVPDGDSFVVNGQKIWTTLAQDATHIFLLVRTDKAAKKQHGISFLLADLNTPGITVRPIRNIAGEEEFCEVFFENARIPQNNLVGGINEGWGIAKALLGYERIFIGSPKTSQRALWLLEQLGQDRNLFSDARFRSEFAALELDLADLRAMYAEFAEIVKRGETLPPSVSILKIWATETYTRISTKLIEAAGEDGGSVGPIEVGDLKLDLLGPRFNAMATTIYGGTNEIQRNVIAQRVLELPN